MSIATELQRIRTAKENIKEAIKAKGVDVSEEDKIDVYPSKIGQITGGGSSEPFNPDAFHLYYIEYYDGDYIKRLVGEINAGDVIELEQGKNVPAMNVGTSRANPDLIWDEWACPIPIVDNKVTIPEYIACDLCIGAVYHPSDGKSHCITTDGTDIETSTPIVNACGLFLSNNVTSIKNTYEPHRDLSVISLPSTIKTIEDSFIYCFVKTIIFPNNIVTAFANQIRLCEAIVFGCNTSTIMYLNDVPASDVWIPSRLSSYEGILSNQTTCVRATIPDVGQPFPNVSFFRSINIPSSFTGAIGSEDDCRNLRYVYIADRTSIENNSFRSCSVLKSVTIPSSVKTIGAGCFNSFSIMFITCKPVVPPTLSEIIGLPESVHMTKVYVPKGSLEAYKTATNWSLYADIMVEMD